MPLPLPQLDDRTWADLMDEALALVPAAAPEWTNFNASDPGITLVELFAYLTETLLYRVDRVTDANRRSFVQLLNGPGSPSHGDVERDIHHTIARLRHCQRAVTAQDFETLAMEVSGGPADRSVARAHALVRRNLESGQGAGVDAPGHVTVVVLPETKVRPTAELLSAVRAVIEPARLITTRVHVVGARLVPIRVQLTLIIEKGSHPDRARQEAVNTLTRYFDPIDGGPDGFGWPFGRAVYVSEIYSLLSKIASVQAVVRTVVGPGDPPLDEVEADTPGRMRAIRNRSGQLEAVPLDEDELIEPRIDPGAIQVRRANP